MIKKLHVRTGDKVRIMSGKDKGSEGKVLEVSPKEGKVIVEGLNIATKHMKPRQMGQQGGLLKVEAPMYASKVMLVCPKCKKATRSAHSFDKNGKKKRLCKKCGETF